MSLAPGHAADERAQCGQSLGLLASIMCNQRSGSALGRAVGGPSTFAGRRKTPVVCRSFPVCTSDFYPYPVEMFSFFQEWAIPLPATLPYTAEVC